MIAIFPIFGKAATSIEPCDGAFDDPAFGKNHEAVLVGAPKGMAGERDAQRPSVMMTGSRSVPQGVSS